jgi:hypothetical protein
MQRLCHPRLPPLRHHDLQEIRRKREIDQYAVSAAGKRRCGCSHRPHDEVEALVLLFVGMRFGDEGPEFVAFDVDQRRGGSTDNFGGDGRFAGADGAGEENYSCAEHGHVCGRAHLQVKLSRL